MSDADIETLARQLVRALTAAGRTLATAESCTGGWIAKALTDIAGSSRCFGWGVVSYSNEAKAALLGVRPETLAAHGAVSEAVVTEMAAGAASLAGADLAVAVSGIAGPDGGSADKPVGTVWFGWAERRGERLAVSAERHRFAGDRAAVRSQSVVVALRGVRQRLDSMQDASEP